MIIKVLQILILLQISLVLIKGDNSCELCRSGRSRCRRIAGIYTMKHLSPGYHPVVDIPVGACSINITELRPSDNYLALKSHDEWFINGNWLINEPGTFYKLGTSFTYDRESPSCRSECIYCQGPTLHKLTVQILYSSTNEGVAYEFVLPPHIPYTSPNQFVYTPRTVHRRRHNHRVQYRGQGYRRDIHRNPTTRLSTDYNTGRSSRRTVTHETSYNSEPRTDRVNLQSRRYNQNDISYRRPEYVDQHRTRSTSPQSPVWAGDSHVRGTSSDYRGRLHQMDSRDRYEALTGPRAEVHVEDFGNLNNATGGIALETPVNNIDIDEPISSSLSSPYNWKITGFTQCTHPCGTGTQTTRIVCVRKDTQVTVTEDNCEDTLKPRPQVVTCNTSPCQPDWVIGEWSICSVTCGAGTQTRRVECKRRIAPNVSFSVSASQCNNTAKPVIVQQCINTVSCTKWHVGPWGTCSVPCGNGVQQRTVNCVNNNNSTVADRLCNSAKPQTSKQCNTVNCNYQWFYSLWSNECSSQCGSGLTTRHVLCSTVEGARVGEDNCDLNKKPDHQKTCQQATDCHSSWFTGPWSKCSTTCGKGVKSRDVVCVYKENVDGNITVVEDSQCNTDKPTEAEECQQSDCDAMWHMSDWSQCSSSCGEGYTTRSVLCLDHNLQPQRNCNKTQQPETRKTCNQQPCVQLNSDPSCRNSYEKCHLVVQARLCRYAYYHKICCDSCKRSGQRVQP